LSKGCQECGIDPAKWDRFVTQPSCVDIIDASASGSGQLDTRGSTCQHEDASIIDVASHPFVMVRTPDVPIDIVIDSQSFSRRRLSRSATTDFGHEGLEQVEENDLRLRQGHLGPTLQEFRAIRHAARLDRPTVCRNSFRRRIRQASLSEWMQIRSGGK
jgi:hypothetical protein